MKHFNKLLFFTVELNMFAVICWTSKNGVALEREELEVQSSSKYVVMNGGKQEAGAAVSMVFRKEIWGGIIQSIHGSYTNHLLFLICSNTRRTL